MKKLLIIFFISQLSYTQNKPTCEDIYDIYTELIELHEKTLLQYCITIEERANLNANLTLDKVVRNKEQFLRNYLNTFTNTKDGMKLLRKIGTVEKPAIACMDNEIYRYDVKNLFTDTQSNLKSQVSPKFERVIDYISNTILKKLKLL